MEPGDIFIVGTPIWFGVRRSLTQVVIERLDGTYDEGDQHLYTNTTARYLAHNVAYVARLLKEHPAPANFKLLVEEAKGMRRLG
jgi:hypothetical protein